MVPSKVKNRVKLVAIAMGLAGALFVLAWRLGYFERDETLSADPAVADLQRAMQQSDKADIELLIRKYNQLSPAQQREFDQRKMLMDLPEQEQKLREFFALSEAEQRNQIDREIDAMEAKSRQADEVTERKGGGRGQSAAGTKAKGGNSSDGNLDSRQILEAKQAWTANASPELRSMMDRRIRMLNERRAERGLGPL